MQYGPPHRHGASEAAGSVKTLETLELQNRELFAKGRTAGACRAKKRDDLLT